MKKATEFLLIGIFVMTALLAAAVGLRAYSGYVEKAAMEEEMQQQNLEELMARNAEAQQRVMEMQSEIANMAEDPESLQLFIDETVNAANDVQSKKEQGVSGNILPSMPGSVSGNTGIR